ncbi:hypothetical protein F4821DRAFT_170699 [Hypoxylon rubiginosum]|uniref:Uncharacterized protein n=1 Tax=Hypoxylon rubiginosum TaxID=110542 RepID=A0ACC0CWF9_9PEZI|nr:hypothetical protein F4821DRAFT_170699 [Hypoxylon rubiginosum]
MRSQTIIAAAAGLLSSSALAQDITKASSCIAALSSLETAFPTPADTALASWINSYALAHAASLATDPCGAITAVPTSLSSAAVSYESQLASYGTAHASDVNSIAGLCGDAGVPGVDSASVASQLGILTGFAGTTCVFPSGALAAPTAALVAGRAGQSTAAQAKGAAATSSATTSSPNAAGARPTGMVAGAAAAAGVLGAVALL